MTDSLKNLLERVDQSMPPAQVASNLSARVCERVRRRSRNRVALPGVALLCASAALIALMTARRPSPASLAQHDSIDRHQTIVTTTLDFDADLHWKTVNLIRQAQHVSQVERQMVKVDPFAELDARCNESASILLRDADDLFSTPGRRAEAIQIYRDLIRSFPDSAAARQAQDRLGSTGA